MSDPRGELEPIEKASIDELRALQLERLRWSLRHAYENVAFYRGNFDAASAHPDDLQSLSDTELAAHTDALFTYTCDMSVLHHQLHMDDLGPLGVYVVFCRDHDIDPASLGADTAGKPDVVERHSTVLFEFDSPEPPPEGETTARDDLVQEGRETVVRKPDALGPDLHVGDLPAPDLPAPDLPPLDLDDEDDTGG